jgi:hypothetical protein
MLKKAVEQTAHPAYNLVIFIGVGLHCCAIEKMRQVREWEKSKARLSVSVPNTYMYVMLYGVWEIGTAPTNLTYPNLV